MEAVPTYEASAYSNETRYIAEGSNLHTRRRDSFECHIAKRNLNIDLHLFSDYILYCSIYFIPRLE
jgi:hypothetical protein